MGLGLGTQIIWLKGQGGPGIPSSCFGQFLVCCSVHDRATTMTMTKAKLLFLNPGLTLFASLLPQEKTCRVATCVCSYYVSLCALVLVVGGRGQNSRPT